MRTGTFGTVTTVAATTPQVSVRSTTVTLPTPRPTVAVVKIKLDLKCLLCGNTWGMWVSGEMLPSEWDKCRTCEQRQTQNEVQQSYRDDITGRRKEIR